MSDLHLRALTAEERAAAYKGGMVYDAVPYVRAVEQMRGSIAYGIVLNGVSAMSTRRRFNVAAKQLGRKLHWAKVAKDAKELVVEIVGETPR